MNEQQALEFVENQGIVTESARSSLSSLAEAVAGEPITGSWWAHPRHSEIFHLTRIVRASPDILVCRLATGKVTFVHRRLWPYLVRLAGEFDAERLAAIREIHTSTGKHQVKETPFPDWVPSEVEEQALGIGEEEARAALGEVLAVPSDGA